MSAQETPTARIAVVTVSHDSAAELEGWWRALVTAWESHRSEPGAAPVRVVVVDNASSDGSVERLRELAATGDGPPLEVVPLSANSGFTGGMNEAFSRLEPQDAWVLALNPDARLRPGALGTMVDAFEAYASTADGEPLRVGSVTARLVRPGELDAALLDACGMYWTRSWRHLDRGSGEPARDRYLAAEEVFAGTGAGTMYQSLALRDVALAEDRPFDEDFHSYREDAELGWRLQRRGWTCLYEPAAVIEHRRVNLPDRRASMSEDVNRHSLKNRYLLRVLHQSGRNVLATPGALLRDVGILAWVLLRERSSLGAYGWLWRERRRLLDRRRVLLERQTIPDARLRRWFRQPSFAVRRRVDAEPGGSP